MSLALADILAFAVGKNINNHLFSKPNPISVKPNLKPRARSERDRNIRGSVCGYGKVLIKRSNVTSLTTNISILVQNKPKITADVVFVVLIAQTAYFNDDLKTFLFKEF